MCCYIHGSSIESAEFSVILVIPRCVQMEFSHPVGDECVAQAPNQDESPFGVDVERYYCLARRASYGLCRARRGFVILYRHLVHRRHWYLNSKLTTIYITLRVQKGCRQDKGKWQDKRRPCRSIFGRYLDLDHSLPLELAGSNQATEEWEKQFLEVFGCIFGIDQPDQVTVGLENMAWQNTRWHGRLW
jgi:hypothetical protein